MTSKLPSRAQITAEQETREKAQEDADQQIHEAFSGRPADRTPGAEAVHKVHEALNGERPQAEQAAADEQVREAFSGNSTTVVAEKAARDMVHRALAGQDDPTEDAEDMKRFHGDPLWMERSEVNLAAEAYRDARLSSLPHSETMASAIAESERERNRYMAAHRSEYTTEAALLEATATHLTGLASAYGRSRGGESGSVPMARETITRTTRIRN